MVSPSDTTQIEEQQNLSNQSSSKSKPTRVSPYPIRIRTPRRQWESLHFVLDDEELYEPTSYDDAMQSSQAHLWKSAIQDEYNSVIDNQTWSLSSLPPGRMPIKSKWVFKIKPGANCSMPCYKARLVVKGFSQRSEIDYGEKFSPVVKYDPLRVILSLDSVHDLEI